MLIVERETHQGKGSTGKSMGGVRAQFATAPNIQMSMYSIQFYSEFDQRLGQPGGYRPRGYLFVATIPPHLEYLRANQILQHSLGLKQAHMVNRDDIKARVPQLRSGDVLGGSFCPTDGFVDPYSVMVGFTTCATERGAKVWKSTEVTAIHRDASGITGVETTRGPVSTRIVVNAAGAWAARVAALADIDLPVQPCAACWFLPNRSTASRTRSPWSSIEQRFHFRPRAWISAGVERSRRDCRIQDRLRAVVHREDPGARRRTRSLLRKCCGQSQACLGGTLRDVARPPPSSALSKALPDSFAPTDSADTA